MGKCLELGKAYRESLYGSKTSHRGIQGSVLAEKPLQKRRISQLGIEEELVQLSRHPIGILCGGLPSIEKEAKVNEKNYA